MSHTDDERQSNYYHHDRSFRNSTESSKANFDTSLHNRQTNHENINLRQTSRYILSNYPSRVKSHSHSRNSSDRYYSSYCSNQHSDSKRRQSADQKYHRGRSHEHDTEYD